MASDYARSVRRSQQEVAAATRVMPGGVNSPARAWSAVGGNPLVIERGDGPRIWDVDGNAYLDYVCSWGALLLGHGHRSVVEAAVSATRKGSSFGAPTAVETALAQAVVSAVASIEMVRCVNSGTEATMSALRLARAATGRDQIVKFDGCYHGHDDALLVAAGSGARAHGIPDSAGVNSKLAADTLVARYNDVAQVRQLFEERPSEIACVIVEPIAGNMGVVPGDAEFLRELRQLTLHDGALLIFDEVISGFRAGFGGAQDRYGITPDITCLGKVIGGGFPVGAYGASASLMQHVAPLGGMYQAGTLSGNPVAMSAGLATLQELQDPDAYRELERKTERLARGIEDALARTEVVGSVNWACGMLTLFFGAEPVRDMASAAETDRAMFAAFFHAMLDRGVYIPPSPFEGWFPSLAHTDADLDETLAAVEGALSAMG